MHLLFIDESGSLTPIGKHSLEDKFVLGGIVISETTWFKVNNDFNILKKKYNITGEIKWRYFYIYKERKHLFPI